MVNEHKLILDPKLTFRKHIVSKIKIARKNLGILKQLSTYLPLKTLDQLYKMLIRPHLDYCDIIYHEPSVRNDFDNTIRLTSLMDMIENIQYKAALIITGTWMGTSRNKLYEELGWESLSDRRWSRRLFQFYKIHNNLCPIYLTDKLPRLRRPLYGNMNTNSYYGIYGRTNQRMNSFFPNSVNSWNSIDSELSNCTSLDVFKRNILALIRPPRKSTFDIHDSFGIKYLFQLRTGLSPLKRHKYCHNFLDTPSALCDCREAPEDTSHFLLHCQLHALPRAALFATLDNILSTNQNPPLYNADLLLYGHRTLNFQVNKLILLSTITFIRDSTRFA